MKTALVTGANRGIGLSIVNGLARRSGWRILLGSRHLEDGQRAATTLDRGNVACVRLDLSERSELERQYRDMVAAHGEIDVLVNNAGLYQVGEVVDLPGEEFERSLRTNLLAPYDLIRLVLPGMIQRGYGRIVNVSAGGGLFSEGLDGPVAYSVSKAALNALTLRVSRALPTDVKVNSMCPGWVHTRMGGDDAPLSVEDGADTALWLATLPADGPSGQFFRARKSVPW